MTTSMTPRTDALTADPRGTSLRLHHAVSLARDLERESARLRDALVHINNGARSSAFDKSYTKTDLRDRLLNILETARAALQVQS